jgi:hypothetical protein
VGSSLDRADEAESDEEQFEDDPIEYIRRDLEPSAGMLLYTGTQNATDMRRKRYSSPSGYGVHQGFDGTL